MYKYLLPTLAALCFTTSIHAAGDLSKDEKKKIKTELKGYKKDPAKFKAMMDSHQAALDSDKAELGRTSEALGQLTNSYNAMQKKMQAQEADLTACMNKPEPKCPDAAELTQIPATGTVYKVQLGLYRKFDMNSFFAKPKFVGSEKVDGLNRYIVSFFDNKEEAEHFAGDLRKLGLHDAFVAKYADGQRIYEKDPKKKWHKSVKGDKAGKSANDMKPKAK